MRVNKMFTIEYEFIERLKGVNASELVNKLLHKHYSSTDPDEMSIKQLKKAIAIEELREEHDKRLKDIEKNGE